MNTQEQNRTEKRLRAVLTSAYPISEPSDALKRRIQEEIARCADMTLRRGQRQRRVRLGLTCTGVAALTILAVFGWPTLVAAQTLHRMEIAVSEIKQMHSITWRVESDGTHEKLRELWTQEGCSRLETPGSIELYTQKTLYSYVPDAKRVLVRPQYHDPFFQSSDLSVGAMVRSVLLSGHPERIQQLKDIELNGQTLKRIAITLELGSKTTGTRSVLYAEAESDLPVRCDNQRLTHTGWLTEQTIEVRYNDLQSADLFKPQYPQDVQKMDVAIDQHQRQHMLKREIGHVRTAQGIVIVHDLQVNAKGDVFLLTSGGNFGGPDMVYIIHKDGTRTAITRPSPLELTDDQGTNYLCQSNFGGQPNVQRWTPLTPIPEPWKARRFTLTFRLADLRTAIDRHAPPPSWSIVVKRPEAAVMPDYLPSVAPGLYWSETRVLADDAVARAQALHAGGKREDLEQALIEYRQVIQIEDDGARQSGGNAVHPETWLGIYGVLRDLGRTDDAREALQTAQDQDVYHNMTQEITEAWQQIGHNR